MAFGNTYTVNRCPFIEGNVSKPGGGGSNPKQFVVDTGAPCSALDPKNVESLYPPPSTPPAVGGSGPLAGCFTGIIATVPVWDPATGMTTPRQCNMKFLEIPGESILGIDQLQTLNAGLPMGNGYLGHRYSAKGNYFVGNALVADVFD